MPVVVSHIIGTVALLSMMIVMAGIFSAFGAFVGDKANEVELDEIAGYVGNHVTQLIGTSNFSTGDFLIKTLDLPQEIGNFGYRVRIIGPPPPLSIGTTISKNPASTVPLNSGWQKTQFGFVSDDKYAEGGIFPSDWWNSDFLFRRKITITNPSSSSSLPAGYSVKLIVNTTGSEFLPNGDDLRIFYDASSIELDRLNTTPFGSANTEIWFQTQASIPPSSDDDDYYMYYGYSGAGSAPQDPSNVYLWFDSFSSNSSSNYDIGRHASIWHGAGVAAPSWDPIAQAVFFNASNNFSGGWKVNGIDELDVYAEIKMKVVGSYVINSTNGILLRWDNSARFYGGHISGGDYSGSPCLVENARTTTLSCISLPSEYHVFDQWFSLGVATWGDNLKLWVDGIERVSTVDPTIADPGSIAFIIGQSVGWVDDFMIRKYQDPEPTLSLDIEETGEWVVYSGFNFGLPSNAVINGVKVISEHFEDNSGKTFLHLQVSKDGGLSFGPDHSLPTRSPSAEGNDTIDATADAIWDAAGINNIAVRYSVSSRSPGELAYKSKTGSGIDFPKIRELEGGIWGGETQLDDVNDPVWAVRAAFSPLGDEYIVVVLNDEQWLHAFVCDEVSCIFTGNIARVEDFEEDSAIPFDIQYESSTGKAILVYAVRSSNQFQDLAYKIWDGSSWGSEQYIDDTTRSSDTKYRSIQLSESSATNELGLIGYESDSDDIQAWIWNGTLSSWQDELEITSISSITGDPFRQNIAIGIMLSGDILAVGGHSNSGEIKYAIYANSSKTWTGPWTFDPTGSSGADVEMLTLKANPNNDMMMLVILTDDRGLHTTRWNGTGWDHVTDHSVQLESEVERGADGDWEPDGGRYVLWYGKKEDDRLSRRIFTNDWGPETRDQIAPFDEMKIVWVTARMNPDPQANNKIMVGLMYKSLDLYTFSWTGASYESIQLITTSMQDIEYEGFDIVFKPSGTADEASLDQVTIEVSYEIKGTVPISKGQTYVVVVTSDRFGLRTGNFTLPWNSNSRLIFLEQYPLNEGVSVPEILSGFREPFIWSFTNSTHIIFGFGSR